MWSLRYMAPEIQLKTIGQLITPSYSWFSVCSILILHCALVSVNWLVVTGKWSSATTWNRDICCYCLQDHWAKAFNTALRLCWPQADSVSCRLLSNPCLALWFMYSVITIKQAQLIRVKTWSHPALWLQGSSVQNRGFCPDNATVTHDT
jgi:hypothetical protein